MLPKRLTCICRFLLRTCCLCPANACFHQPATYVVQRHNSLHDNTASVCNMFLNQAVMLVSRPCIAYTSNPQNICIMVRYPEPPLHYCVSCGLDLHQLPCTIPEVPVAYVCMMYYCLPCCFDTYCRCVQSYFLGF